MTSFRAIRLGSPWIYIPTLVMVRGSRSSFSPTSAARPASRPTSLRDGNALQYASIPCLFAMTNTIAGERHENTLAYILVSPAGRIPIFLGRALPTRTMARSWRRSRCCSAGSSSACMSPPGARLLAFVILVTAYSCTGFGLISAGLGLRIRETAVLANVIFGVLLIFTGANVPLDTLPSRMSAISGWLPITHGIEAARRIADGASLGDVSGSWRRRRRWGRYSRCSATA